MATDVPAMTDEACDRQFFAAEVERLIDRLYGLALSLTRDGADAEDLVSEALSKAWARLDSLHDRQAFEKWMFRIIVNTFISDRRRRKVRPAEESVDGMDDGGDFSLFEQVHQPFLLWWGNPEQQLLDKLLRADIERALQSLPESYRVAVILVDVQGFSYGEAADALEVPVGTVRSRLSRGRSLLQRALWRQARQLGIAAARSKGEGGR